MSLGDMGGVHESLQNVCAALAMSNGSLRVTPFIPPLVQLVDSANMEVALLALRALNSAVDLDARCAAHLAGGGALPRIIAHLQSISDIDVSESAMKW